MTSSRRRFLLGTGATIALLSGCSRLPNVLSEPRTLYFVVYNNTSEANTFHFATETKQGLEDWVSLRADANEDSKSVVDISDLNEIVAVHGFVDDVPLRTTKIDSTEKCLIVTIVYDQLDEKPWISWDGSNGC